MKAIFSLALALSLVVSTQSFAAAPATADFSKINLVGFQMIDSEGQNGFRYKLKQATPDAVTLRFLEDEANSKIVSPVFELDEKSSFKNIYVFIGQQENGTYELAYLMLNKSGSYFLVDMDITAVEKNELTLSHGPSDSLEILKASSTIGSLFP